VVAPVRNARETDIQSFQQRRLPDVLQPEQPAHLLVEPCIDEWVRGKLDPQQAADDFLGVGEGIKHDANLLY
jgi:hypothetical protein